MTPDDSRADTIFHQFNGLLPGINVYPGISIGNALFSSLTIGTSLAAHFKLILGTLFHLFICPIRILGIEAGIAHIIRIKDGQG